MRTAGNWAAAGGVQTDKTAESIVEFDKELKDLAGARPISADELAVAKQRRVRGYAQQFEAFTRVAGEIANLWSQGLPMTELQRELALGDVVVLDSGEGKPAAAPATAGSGGSR